MKKPWFVSVRTWEGSRLEAVHFLQHMPQKSRVLAVTRLLFVIGGFFLAAGLAAGWAGIHAVYSQETLRRVWLDIAKSRGLPEKLVPPVQGEPMLELAAMAAFLVGTVLVVAALARHVRWKSVRDRFTIGDDPVSSWVCSARRLPSSCFELISVCDGSCRLQVCDWMRASVRQNDVRRNLTELESESAGIGVRVWNLQEFDEIRVEHDGFAWVITPEEARAETFPLRLRPGLFAPLLLSTLGVFGAMVLMFDRVSRDPFFGGGLEADEVQLRALVRMPDRVSEKRRELESVRKKDQEKTPVHEVSLSAAAEERVSGHRDPRVVKPAGEGDSSSVRTAGPQTAGVANVLASAVSVMTASLTANNAVFGQETEDLSDLLGDFDPSDGGGNPGFGPRGSPGPGGPGGTLGIGGPPQIGWGRLPGSDVPGPSSFNPIAGKPRRPIVMRDGSAQVNGRMDPHEVRAVIRAHRAEVHHCYQKGLLEDDRLAGVVRVLFLLNASGRASDCRVEENLARVTVGECICSRIQNWRFPQPEGSLVRIQYSWILQPGNDSF